MAVQWEVSEYDQGSDVFFVCFVIRFYVACLLVLCYTVFSWTTYRVELRIEVLMVCVYVFLIYVWCSVIRVCVIVEVFLLVVRAAACVSVRYAQTEQRRFIKLGFDGLCEFAILRGGWSDGGRWSRR